MFVSVWYELASRIIAFYLGSDLSGQPDLADGNNQSKPP